MEEFDLSKWQLDGNNLLQKINGFYTIITPISVAVDDTDNLYEIVASNSREDSINYVLVIVDDNNEIGASYTFPLMTEAIFFAESYLMNCNNIEDINKCYHEYLISNNATNTKGLIS